MGRRMIAAAVIAGFLVGAGAGTAEARFVKTQTKIVHLTHSVSDAGPTLFVAGEIKVDAIPRQCASGRDVYLYAPGKDPKNGDAYAALAFAYFEKPYDFHLNAPAQNGTWLVYVPKYKAEKTKICLGTRKTLDIP